MTIEERIQRLEDRAEIADLIARFGPIVDSGNGEKLTELWADDGEYRVGDEYTFVGGEIARLTDLETHQAYLARGCSHILTAPDITINGDQAYAVNHSVVLIRAGEGWVADRVSANQWEMKRTVQGWRVVRRSNALLDGSEAARALLVQERLG